MTSRRKSRELALSCMYEIDVGKHDPEVVLERTIESQDVQGAAQTFLRSSVRLAWGQRAVVDEIIGELAVGWRLERIAKVDLAILRLTIVELLIGLEDERPPDAVAINEAVVLAKKFSTQDSGKFINGILATVVRNKEQYQSALGVERKDTKTNGSGGGSDDQSLSSSSS